MVKKVAVVMGGFSSERDVSLVSGKGIVAALKKKKYNVVAHDLKDTAKFFKFLEKEQPDVVFNALHGTFGEDGAIQGFLDMMQIPYTHSGLESCAMGMNKILTKEICADAGVRCAPHQIFTAKEFMKKAKSLKMPFVVKPISDGSSFGVFVVREFKDIKKVRYEKKDIMVMVEPFIDGKELTCMVLNDKAYVVTELRPKTGFYDYKAKYTGGVTEHILPAEIPERAAAEIKDFAVKAHKSLACRVLSRSDFRYNPKDGVVFLELNTHPGMTPLSLVPEQAKYAKISYEKLCSILVENASCKKRQ